MDDEDICSRAERLIEQSRAEAAEARMMRAAIQAQRRLLERQRAAVAADREEAKAMLLALAQERTT